MEANYETKRLLAMLPPDIAEVVAPRIDTLEEIVLDVDRPLMLYDGKSTWVVPHIRVDYHSHLQTVITNVTLISRFKSNNRAGIEGTYHRVSKKISDEEIGDGITIRIGRYVEGAAAPLLAARQPIREAGQNPPLLIIGAPGTGKTTILRDIVSYEGEAFRLGSRLVVVDTSNEISGEGSKPMPFLKCARVMKVPDPSRQAAILMQAVANHGPHMVMVDEIGYYGEVAVLHTIGRRGISIVASAHGSALEEALENHDLYPLFGLANPNNPSMVSRPIFAQALVINRNRTMTFFPDLKAAIKQHLAGQTPKGTTLDPASKPQSPKGKVDHTIQPVVQEQQDDPHWRWS